MKRILPICSSIALALSLLAVAGPSSLQAQVVTWSPIQNITGNGSVDVQVNGSYVDALYIGGSGPLTFNGIQFNSVSGPGTYASTNISFSAVDITPGGSFHGAALTASLSSPGYQALLQNSAYNVGYSSFTLSGLVADQTYQLQLWVNAPSDGNLMLTNLQNGTFPTLDGGTALNATGAGQYIVGTFAATGATFNLAIAVGDGAPINGITAVSLQAVPEPSTVCLIGLALGAVLFMARRRVA